LLFVAADSHPSPTGNPLLQIPTSSWQVRMPTEKPKTPPPVRQSVPLRDLPAQPVDAKEAEGVKGGTPGESSSSRTGTTSEQ
jgi:hypothetical protein